LAISPSGPKYFFLSSAASFSFATIASSLCVFCAADREAEFSYFEKPYEYTANLPQVSTLNPEETIPETIHDKGKDFFVDGGYYRTLACNLKSVYWGIGLGGFIGTEYVRHPDKEYNFIIGPKLETELEVFILPRTALLARIQQHWNPLSIDKWNTVWNVGIKILLY
jgi:hypothetical protein